MSRDSLSRQKAEARVKARQTPTSGTVDLNDPFKWPSPATVPALEELNQIIEAGKKIQDNDAARSKIRTNVSDPLKTRQRKKEILSYPEDRKEVDTDYLEIKVINYKPIGANRVQNPGSRTNKAKEILRTIQLPIPSNVQDGNSVSYESSNLNGIVAAAAGGAGELMKLDMGKLASAGGRGELETQLKEIFGNAVTGVGGFNIAGDLVNKLLISQAVGILGGNITPSQLLAREEGAIFNPNMELLFNGPTLRQFRFSFKMTPRRREEGEIIKKIIRDFKESMAPKVVSQGGTQNLFLRTPNVFELCYKTGSRNHEFLHRFKQCALTDMSVNYTGEGTYATYDNSTPISMIMDLTFKELEPIYDTDYNDGIGGVGY